MEEEILSGDASSQHLQQQRSPSPHLSTSSNEGTTGRLFTDTEECIRSFKAGGMIIVMDDENRENEGDLIMAAQFATEKSVAFIIRHSTGILCTAMPNQWADHLALPPMVSVNTDPNGTAFTVTCDHMDAGTGVSASHRALTITSLADPSTESHHIRRPGHIFPLVAREGGVLVRRGHTEASVDLCRLSGLRPVGLLSELCNDDGTMMRLDDCLRFSKTYNIPIMSIEELVRYRSEREAIKPTLLLEASSPSSPPTPIRYPHRTVELVAQCEIPVQFDKSTYLGLWLLRVFVSHHDCCQHVVLSQGDVSDGCEEEAVLTRIHSECFTGNTLGSIRCDCGPQLQQSMEIIHKKGRGVVLYVAGHEGRGIGLINKIRAYEVQTKDLLDTYQANISLGLPSDNRDYSSCLAILEALHISKIRLLTSNPEKMHAFQHLTSEVVPLSCKPNQHNQAYLQAKRNHNAELSKLLNVPVPLAQEREESLDGERHDTGGTVVDQVVVTRTPTTTPVTPLSSSTSAALSSASVIPLPQQQQQQSSISIPTPSRARHLRLAIIHTTWNNSLIKPLVDGCVSTLCKAGVMRDNVQVIDVPGSFELPLATQMVAQTRSVNAVLCVGILLKGETMHEKYLAESVVHGLMKVQLKTNVPVLNGVLSCMTLSQAEQRCLTGPNNLSQSLALSLLHMAGFSERLHESFPPCSPHSLQTTLCAQPCTDYTDFNYNNNNHQHNNNSNTGITFSSFFENRCTSELM